MRTVVRACFALVLAAAVAIVLAVPAGPETGTATSERWAAVSAPSPQLTTGYLSSVSCFSGTECIAVGYHYRSATQLGFSGSTPVGPLAERWNGKSWTALPVANPNPSSSIELSGISCVSFSFCLAAGYDRGYQQHPVLETWNGTRWAADNLGAPVGLSGVSCVSPADCEAVGDYEALRYSGKTFAERWNGHHWAVQPTPTPGRSTAFRVTAVSCPSSRRCQAVGKESGPFGVRLLAEAWNGRRWSFERIRNPKGDGDPILNALSCTTVSRCEAVGGNGLRGGKELAVTESWNGARWTIQPAPRFPGRGASLSSVSCPSVTTCQASGSGSTFRGVEVPAAALFDGTHWTDVSVPTARGGAGSAFEAVSCGSRSSCEGVGERSTASSVFSLAEGWSRSHWSPQKTVDRQIVEASSLDSVGRCVRGGRLDSQPGHRGRLATRRAVGRDGVEVAVSAESSVGELGRAKGGVVLRTRQLRSGGRRQRHLERQLRTLADVWNGRSWRTQVRANSGRGTTKILKGISCTSTTHCVAVGLHGGVYPNYVTEVSRNLDGLEVDRGQSSERSELAGQHSLRGVVSGLVKLRSRR